MKVGKAAALMAVTGLVALLVVILPVCGINGVGSDEEIEGMHGDEKICKGGIEMPEREDIDINYGRNDETETYRDGALLYKEYGEDVPAAAPGEVGGCLVSFMPFTPKTLFPLPIMLRCCLRGEKSVPSLAELLSRHFGAMIAS